MSDDLFHGPSASVPEVRWPGGTPGWLSGGGMPGSIQVDPSYPLMLRCLTNRVAIYDFEEVIDLSQLLPPAGVSGSERPFHFVDIAGWSIRVLATEGLDRSPWGGGALRSLFAVIRCTAEWMYDQGRSRLDRLSAYDIQELKVRLYHLDRSTDPPGPVTRGATLGSLTVLRKLYLRGRIPDGFAINPTVEDAACVKRVLRLHRLGHPEYVDKVEGHTKSIPWAIAQEFVGAAIGLVEHPLAPRIIEMAAAMYGLRQSRTGSALIGARERLFKSWWGSRSERDVLEQFALSEPAHVEHLLRDLVVACWIVIALFAALRLEEAASLLVDNPVEVDASGLWLQSWVKKTSPELNGSLVPLPVPPIVKAATELAAAATSHHRGLSKQLLIFEFRGNDDIVLRSGFASDCMRAFARRRCSTQEARTFPYASHQVRRLWVQLYVRRFEGRIEDAQQHLRHVSAAMIEVYMADPELVRMIEEEQSVFVGEVMRAVMSGDERAVGFSASSWTSEGARNAAITLTIEQAARFVAAKQMSLRATALGYCMVSRDTAMVPACGVNVDGLPEISLATEATCSGCARSLSLERHVPLLKAIFVVHKQVVKSDVSGPLREYSEKVCGMLSRRIDRLVTDGSEDA